MLVPFYSLPLPLSLPFTSISKLALHTFTPFFTFPFLLVGLLGAFPVWAETPILHHPLQHPDQLLLQLSLLYSVPPPLSFTPSYTLAAHSSLHLARFPSLSPPLTLTHSHTLSNLLLLSLTPSSISLERYNTPFGTDSRLHSLPSSALHCLKLSLTLALPTFLPTLAFFTSLPPIFPCSHLCHPFYAALAIARTHTLVIYCTPLSLRSTQHTTHYPSFPGGSWLECEAGSCGGGTGLLETLVPLATYSTGSVGS